MTAEFARIGDVKERGEPPDDDMDVVTATEVEREPAATPRGEFGPGELSVGGRRAYILRRLLAASDVLALCTAFGAMVGARSLLFDREPVIPQGLEWFALLLPAWIALAAVMKLYHLGDRGLDYSVSDEIGSIFVAATVWNWALLMTVAVTDPRPVLEVLPLVLLWVASIVLLPLFRVLTVWLARRASWYRQRVLVIGSDSDSGRVLRRIERHPEYALEIAAIAEPLDAGHFSTSLFTARGNGQVAQLRHRFIPPEAGTTDMDGLVALAREANVSRVIVASAPTSLEERSDLIRRLIDSGAHVDIVSGDPDLCSSSASALHFVEGLPVLTVPSKHVPQTWKVVKRSVDIATAGLGIVALSPVLIAFALAIKLNSPGPVLFRQRRIGRDGHPFELLKFRTMVDGADGMKREVAGLNMHAADEADAEMFKIPEDPRITRVGAFLRRWSLDELPQLWNVLKGQMSVVGPRPLIPEEAGLVEGRYEVRLEMRPGITGPWQTLGRSDIGFDDMIKLDYAYVMTWTLSEDFKLMIRTGEAVVRGRGAY